MIEYIKRDEAKAKKVYIESRHEYAVPVSELDWIPAADVVKVVRCKDCIYRTWFAPYYGCGNYNAPWYSHNPDYAIFTKPDDFCNYGEKGTQNEN